MNNKYEIEQYNIVSEDKNTSFMTPKDKRDSDFSLFHYTDLNALISILKNHQLWLTDSLYLNDSEEMFDGVKILTDSIHSDDFSVITPEIKTDISDAIDRIKSRNIPPHYIASFSEQSDLLSQWRAYGMFCIEFDSSKINNIQCAYSSKDKSEVAYNSINNCNEAIQLYKMQGANFFAKRTLYLELIIASLRMKNEGFSEEKEHRMIVSVEGQDRAKKVQFRASNNIVVPYIAWDFDPKAIKAIHIGPVKDKALSRLSIENMLRHLSDVSPELYGHLEVKESVISYRS
ncbi:hypothetical protein CWO07_02005 [Vibrio splendidus]|uniref:DUF2971 domain-containing protein n=1 Tax=Vibrio splendidus TaxID=29497 RepID=A0A2T5F0T4_VIBSP|nr:DUF2971 domain-containing protein [Vibrio splendidus]PTP39364.1 hypothetical protein CWO07_02005 [Vibrio splendidus]